MLFTKDIQKGKAEELIFDGRKLSHFTSAAEVITTGVEGRDGYSANLFINDDIDGRDGGLFLDYRLPSRRITVHYLLRAKTAELYRQAFNELAHVFSQYRTPASIEFSDEPGWSFQGVLKEFSLPAPGRLSVEGSLSFLCPSPYKYGPSITLGPAGKIRIPTLRTPIKPDKLVVFPEDGSEFTINNLNTGKRIALLGPMKAGDHIEIEGTKITKNNVNAADMVDFAVTTLSGFDLHTNDIVTISNGTLEITYRERML